MITKKTKTAMKISKTSLTEAIKKEIKEQVKFKKILNEISSYNFDYERGVGHDEDKLTHDVGDEQQAVDFGRDEAEDRNRDPDIDFDYAGPDRNSTVGSFVKDVLAAAKKQGLSMEELVNYLKSHKDEIEDDLSFNGEADPETRVGDAKTMATLRTQHGFDPRVVEDL